MYQLLKIKLTIPILMIAFGFASCGEQNRTSNKSKDKPNIVIILSDDQGNADAGYQRSPSTISTPAIDKLASEGVV
ncbi:MAG: hypothetical protein KAQ79_06750, partial [Cyclobacteriaceae bacterium]|nr:hypothetical protein [Cyclobacteriaceae bacterium]